MFGILALSPLTKAILNEYAWVLGIVLFFFAITFIGGILIEKDEKGSGFGGNFGLVIILIFVRIGVVLAAGVYAGVVKPILIFVRYHADTPAKSGNSGTPTPVRLSGTPLMVFIISLTSISAFR